ncbi:hypothetical protein SLEP1_g42122 [Rubroshorea leprosula]|uniref:Transposase MuDR plant domain-containing protein n=1 Tax=Rubroshorea leprosula TaxID=152421 RepID=A0AAV5L9Q0_9ROSI|nr:hypothetical protein SLEP1_g42122 [Rubroshorea leprosula]
MRYLLNERSIIDVYVEHVCDEPDILYMLECGSIPCDAVDEINDIGPSVVNKDVVYEDDEFFDAVHSEGEINDEDEEVHDEEEEVHDDEDEIDDEEVHDDEVEVHDDEQNDEDEFLDALLSDVDDEEVVEAIDEDEEEYEFTVRADARTRRSADVWFNPSWPDVGFEVEMKFEHASQFKEALAKYQIQKGCKLKMVKSDLGRHRIKCDDPQCNCKILEKAKILKEMKETSIKEFARLKGYVEELLMLSPESNVQIDTEPATTPEGKPQFKGIYVCLEGCRKGFLLGCRPMMGVYTCFLKGMCKGTLLVAVAKDRNNQMFPMTWAIVDSECTSSRTFFFKCLADDLSNHTGIDLTFISYQHLVSVTFSVH